MGFEALDAGALPFVAGVLGVRLLERFFAGDALAEAVSLAVCSCVLGGGDAGSLVSCVLFAALVLTLGFAVARLRGAGSVAAVMLPASSSSELGSVYNFAGRFRVVRAGDGGASWPFVVVDMSTALGAAVASFSFIVMQRIKATNWGYVEGFVSRLVLPG
jgi:hypothetical protein